MRYFFLIALLCLDAISKIGALAWVPPMLSGNSSYPFGGIGIFSNVFGISFSLNCLVNTGTAWGLFPGHPGLLFGLRVLIISGLLYYLFLHRKRSGMLPLWVAATGAIGNIIDYLLYGHVIDFFHFTFWGYSFPVFNLADSYITVAVCYMFFFPSFKQANTIST